MSPQYQKSDAVNRYVFTFGTILPNFILIRFETTEPWAFVEQHHSNEKKKE